MNSYLLCGLNHHFLPNLSKKRLNIGSAIKSKKLGYESHSNSMVRIGTFLYGGTHIES
jgi:hypothetical protein